MRIFNILLLAIMLPLAANAQRESSVNTFSPYTMYGLGNLNHSSNTAFTGMGGASIGFRNGGFDTNADIRVNVANPASLSGLIPGNFVFDVGLAGSNVYLGQRIGGQTLRSSFNTFNINNITVALPLAPKLGLAVNVSPFSEVGYRIHTDDTSYLADLGVVRYYYDGEGDVTEAKIAVGWEPFSRVSIGAELIYMWGNTERIYQATILNFTGPGQYGEISSRGGSTATTSERVSRIFGSFGVQYTPVNKAKTRLTLGATYRPGRKLNSEITDYIPSNNIYGDTVRFNKVRSAARMPSSVGIGAFLHRPKWSVGADYVYSDWARGNAYDAVNNVGYVDTHTFKLGAQYTPNRFDARGKVGSFFNHLTYKAGLRMGSHYMSFGGQRLNERAVTFGIDVPFRAAAVSMLSVGVELGERGSLRGEMVRERYFKVNVGVMLYGRDHDYWFEKIRYN